MLWFVFSNGVMSVFYPPPLDLLLPFSFSLFPHPLTSPLSPIWIQCRGPTHPAHFFSKQWKDCFHSDAAFLWKGQLELQLNQKSFMAWGSQSRESHTNVRSTAPEGETPIEEDKDRLGVKDESISHTQIGQDLPKGRKKAVRQSSSYLPHLNTRSYPKT